jgi:hypothetical protein
VIFFSVVEDANGNQNRCSTFLVDAETEKEAMEKAREVLVSRNFVAYPSWAVPYGPLRLVAVGVVKFVDGVFWC